MEGKFDRLLYDPANSGGSTNNELMLEKLREKEHFIRHITEAFPDIIVVYDLIWHQLIYINKVPYSILGYDPEDLDQTSFEERLEIFFDGEDQEKVINYLNSFADASDTDVLTHECRARSKNGELVWIYARGRVFKRDIIGRPVYVLFVLCNTTRYKLAQEQLSAVVNFQQAILDNAGAIIIATDAAGVITLFNPAAEKALGYKAHDVVNQKTPEIFHDRQEVLQRAQEFSKELKTPVPVGFETFVLKAKMNIQNEHEWIFIRKDGSRFFVSLTVTAIRDAEGNITGYLGIAVDISKQKAAEENLQRGLKKEKELNELKSRFVSMASHEFRTPLSTISSSAELIERYKSSEDHAKRQKHMERILSSVSILTQILDDFLSVGKIEEGKIAIKPAPIDIRLFVTSLIQELKSLKRKGQKIVNRHYGEEVVVLDPVLLRHIIINLISNSIKFSPEDSQIDVSTQLEQGVLTLSVKDRGMGIAKEDQQHLSELFFRGKNVVHIQGTGLGLHIIARYTELMNGQMQFKSRLGKGTEFILTFNTQAQPVAA